MAMHSLNNLRPLYEKEFQSNLQEVVLTIVGVSFVQQLGRNPIF